MGCGDRILRWILNIFNIAALLAGAAALGLGIWMATDEDAFDILGITNPEGMDYTIWKVTVYIMIGVGAVIIGIAILGLLGTCCRSSCLLLIYSILLFISLAASITCAVLAIVYQDEINNAVADSMYDDLVHKYTIVDNTSNSYVSSWNKFQSELKCCGAYNYTDWHANPYYNLSDTTGNSVPWTCCKMKYVSDPPRLDEVKDDDACYNEGSNTDPSLQPTFIFLNNKGCYSALVTWVDDKSVIIYAVMLGLVGLQILTLVFGCMMYCSIKKRKTRVRSKSG